MRSLWWSLLVVQILFLLGFSNGESPYRWYNWNITYGDIYPLGVKQQVSRNALDLKHVYCFFLFLFFFIWENLCIFQGILINGQFPGPPIDSVTNDNLIINVFNSLDEPFLLSWWVLLSLLNIWMGILLLCKLLFYVDLVSCIYESHNT